jgi:hypothetical protein
MKRLRVFKLQTTVCTVLDMGRAASQTTDLVEFSGALWTEGMPTGVGRPMVAA